jgi:SAM-dependent methyltransferase
MKNKKKINFDQYSNDYKHYINDSIDKFDKNLSYYHQSKIEITKNRAIRNPKNILDFGCGVGTMIPYMKKKFKKSKIYAFDESKDSLKFLKKRYPFVSCLKKINGNIKFDLIFLSGVIHHIDRSIRKRILKKIYLSLKPKGKLIIFEHNPYNPLTNIVVKNCEFDRDAQLIKRKELINICENVSFVVDDSAYVYFFPTSMKKFKVLEKYLEWFFLGAQYFCIFKKNET